MAGSDSLNGKAISDTYKDLLQVPNANSGVDGTLRTVMDGEGTESTLQVSTAGVKSTGTLESTGNLTVGGTLTLGGTAISSLEDGATADQTGAEIKTAYEGEADTNAFTDADHSKLDGIEANADVTDATNVEAAGALMDSELTDLAGVKGVTISTLQPKPSEGAFADGDKTKLDGITASANNYSHPDHTGEVTSTGDGATVIADNVVDEANLKVSNSPTDGYSLVARSGETGGLKWESVSGGGGGGSGTVTSVAVTGSDGIDVDSGSPITSSGTIALGLSNIGDAAISSAATWNAKQDALTFGIANTNAVQIDSADVADDEYARFTANGLESRSGSEVLSDIGAAASAHNHNSHYLQISNNLSDLNNASTARTNLGLGAAAEKDFDTAGGVQAYDADTTKNDVSNSWTAAQQGATDTQTVTATSVTLDFDSYQNFILTLDPSSGTTVQLSNPTADAGNTGQTGVIVLIQPSGGGKTISLETGGDFKPVGGNTPTISSTANAVDVLPYMIQADNTILLGAPQLDLKATS